MDEAIKRLRALTRHIENVRNNCEKLSDILIEKGETDLALKLIANGHAHDNSKFSGIEWLYLNDHTRDTDKILFDAAHLQHVTTNLHHPEAWSGDLKAMNRLYQLEMVCDWGARGAEFGTNLREYFTEKACKKWKLAPQCKVYKEIKDIIDMLLDPPFK